MQPPPAADWFVFWKPQKYPFTFWYPSRTQEGSSLEVYEKVVGPNERILRCHDNISGHRDMEFVWWYTDKGRSPQAQYDWEISIKRQLSAVTQTTLRGKPAWQYFSRDRPEKADLTVFLVPVGRQLVEVSYDPRSAVAEQILANLAFHALEAPPGPPASAPPRPIVSKTKLAGWQLFSSARMPVQFHYPQRTALGAQVICYEDHIAVWDRVNCQSVGTDEFYFELIIDAPTRETNQFFLNGAGSQRTTAISETTFGGRPATTFQYRAGAFLRTVFLVPLGDKLCTLYFESDSPDAQQMAATLEFV